MTNFNDRIERLAELEAKAAHDIWAHWMKYMFTQGEYQHGNFVIPFENVARWQRQMLTEFKDLSPQEQKSDFEIADQFINHLLREMAHALSEAQAENERLRDGIKDVSAKFSEMEKLRSQFYTEKEQAETALLFANRERDALQSELSSLKADMFLLNNDMDYTTGILEDVLK